MTNLNRIKHLTAICGMLLSLLSSPASLHSAWQEPVVISNPDIPQFSGSAPVLKVNPPGNAIAIWTDAFTNIFDEPAIATAFYLQGGGWQPPQVISNLQTNCDDNPLYVNQGDPDIAMNSTNYAVAVWEGIDNNCDIDMFPGGGVVFAATRNIQGIWSVAEIISDQNFYSDNVNVSLNENGTALAAWRNVDDVNHFISVSFLPLNGSWSLPFDFPSFPQVPGDGKPYPFINSNESAVVTWQARIDNDIFTIQAANYIFGIWSLPVTLDTGTQNISQDPRCALAPNGNAVAIWQNGGFIRASFFNGTTWGAAVTLGDATSLSDNDGPEVVVDPLGNFTATWTSLNNTIFSASTTSGVWTAPQIISSPGRLYSFDPFQSQETLAVNPNGDVIAIYHAISIELAQPSFTPIFSAYKPFGLPWRVQETVAFPSDGFSDFTLNIGLANCGFAVALWQNADDTLVYAAVNDSLILPIDPIAAQCCQKTATGRRCVNILTWTPDDCVLFYNIFCNDILIATVINTGGPLQFIHPLVCNDCDYTITAVSVLGFESDPVPFVFN